MAQIKVSLCPVIGHIDFRRADRGFIVGPESTIQIGIELA